MLTLVMIALIQTQRIRVLILTLNQALVTLSPISTPTHALLTANPNFNPNFNLGTHKPNLQPNMAMTLALILIQSLCLITLQCDAITMLLTVWCQHANTMLLTMWWQHYASNSVVLQRTAPCDPCDPCDPCVHVIQCGATTHCTV